MKNAIILCKVATLLTILLLAPVLAAAHGLAAGTEGAESREQPSLQVRVTDLEQRQTEIYHSLAEKKAAGLASHITERVSLSGLIEVEAAAERIEFAASGSTSDSDLTLATVQLGLGVEVTEQIRGNIVLLHEEDGADLEVDEAAIDLVFAPLFGRIGRLYVPFGVYHSHFVSDPLTLELGETRESAALIGYGHEFYSISFFIFNGDSERVGDDDHIDDWGSSFVLTPTEGLKLGGSYLSDLADSDAELVAQYHRRVAGWSAFINYEQGAFGVNGEVLGATKSFAAADLDKNSDGLGDKPLAWNIELSWALDLVELAARYEGSSELAGHPKRQYGVTASWSPWEHNTLSLEYLRGEFDHEFDRDEDGNILDERNLVTAQWAFEF